MNLSEMDTTILGSVFEFLDKLRDSGRTNMFGATPYIEEEFGFTKGHSRKILMAWQDTFGFHDDPLRRAEEAMEREDAAA